MAPNSPADVAYQCISEVPSAADLTAIDNCAGNILGVATDVTDNSDPCNVIITRTWTFTDGCNNTSNVSQTITVADTIAPIATNDLSDIFVTCSQIPEPPTLAFDDCSSNVTIVNFEEVNTSDGTETDYEIIWNWTVVDTCGNQAQLSQAIFVTNENIITSLNDDRCTDDGIIDLFDYYNGTDTSGTWISENNSVTLDGSFFDPISVELGDYTFSYTVMENSCTSTTEVTINVNDDCIVLAPEPCDRENIIVSTAITPNGDQWNENFEISGVDSCGFAYDIQIFNRWGAIIYKTNNYQNNWNGTAHNSSVGGADKVPSGTYYYIINVRNSGFKPLTGYFYVGTK